MSATRKPNINANLSASADWPPELVIYELHRRRLSLRQLSIRNGYAPRTLCDALRRPWIHGEKIIARALRMPPSEIWPVRFANRRARGTAA